MIFFGREALFVYQYVECRNEYPAYYFCIDVPAVMPLSDTGLQIGEDVLQAHFFPMFVKQGV